ncbi:MAG: hypothetical protein ACR2P3_13380 [Geminicoccaceae bacterium]
MTDAAPRTPPLIDDLQAMLVGLEHARRSFGKDGHFEADGLWPRLERCALRIAALDRNERDIVKPTMLALLDELEQAIAVFGAEHRQLGDKLRSASRNMAAGAAYRQAKAR